MAGLKFSSITSFYEIEQCGHSLVLLGSNFQTKKDSREVFKRENLFRDFLLPALFDPGHDRVEILVEPLLPLFGIIPAAVGIALDEPDCIGRPEILHQHAKPLDPDLIQRLYFHPSSPPSATARDYVLR
jgi:hypothetical protein